MSTFLNPNVIENGSIEGIKIKDGTISSSKIDGTVASKNYVDTAVDDITTNYATKDELAQKQDIISDINTIRSNAANYQGTVTGVKINGTIKNPSSGIVDLGTVITEHQSLKTINGENIVGSGDITISGGDSEANVMAVDTGDIINDVTVEYTTKTYVDGLVGDINSVLESIING